MVTRYDKSIANISVFPDQANDFLANWWLPLTWVTLLINQAKAEDITDKKGKVN